MASYSREKLAFNASYKLIGKQLVAANDSIFRDGGKSVIHDIHDGWIPIVRPFSSGAWLHL